MSGGEDEDKTNEKEETRVKKEHFCYVCSYRTTSEARLNRHYQSHINDTPLRCPYTTCDPNIARLYDRPLSVRLNPGDALRPGYMPCLKQFRQQRHLDDHMRTHLEETPFKCTITGCFSAFSMLSQLTRHLTDHKNPKNKLHQCKCCSKQFSTPKSLANHVASHASDQNIRFICNKPDCEFKSAHYREFVGHLKDAHDENVEPLRCPYCSYVGSTPSYLERHISVDHKKSKKKPGTCTDNLDEKKPLPRQGQVQDETAELSSSSDEKPGCSKDLPKIKKPRKN